MTYWFCDNESGEEFFVEASARIEAWEIAEDTFGKDLTYYGRVSELEAEMMGLDTY